MNKKVVKSVSQHQSDLVSTSVGEVIRMAGLSDIMAQLNERAISVAIDASLNEDRSGAKVPTTIRVPVDVNTFYRVWGEAMGISSQQIIELVLRGYYENLLLQKRTKQTPGQSDADDLQTT